MPRAILAGGDIFRHFRRRMGREGFVGEISGSGRVTKGGSGRWGDSVMFRQNATDDIYIRIKIGPVRLRLLPSLS